MAYKNARKFFFASLAIIAMVAIQAVAVLAQPPDYDELGETIIVDATVSGDTATASNLSGDAGDTIVINAPLSINGASISQIRFKLKNGITGGKVTISVIDQPSVTPPPGAIGFFKIELEGFTDDDIESAEIIFKVGNEYVSVQLYRLTDGTWVALPTSRVSTGTDESTYNADSPGLSEFAIVAKKGKVTKADELPFTGGLPLYLIGGLGLFMIASGLVIRIKSAK